MGELQLEGMGLRRCGGSRERRQKGIGVMTRTQERSWRWRYGFESHQRLRYVLAVGLVPLEVRDGVA